MAKKLREIYQLKIELKGIRPPIWRRFLASNVMSLEDFHHTLQIVMGWTNSHLHQFIVGNERYGAIDPDFDMDWDDSLQDEKKFKLKEILKNEGESIFYEYDFGDGWEHKLTLEKILPFTTGMSLPSCLKGRRGCPPEDVGGPWGYSDFLEKWIDDNNPEHEEIREWVGDHFYPEEFSEVDVNEVLGEAFKNV
jgi:hypothetical protein